MSISVEHLVIADFGMKVHLAEKTFGTDPFQIHLHFFWVINPAKAVFQIPEIFLVNVPFFKNGLCLAFLGCFSFKHSPRWLRFY